MSGQRRPVLTLLVAPAPPETLTSLLVAMLPWCTPKASDAAINASAVLATSPSAPGVEAAARHDLPLAVWVRSEDEAAEAAELRPRALLTASAPVAAATGALLVDGAAAAVDQVSWVPPFVRSRLRRQAGLSEVMVLDARLEDLPDDVLPTALGVCSACIAPARHLLQAVAWGAPTVTDPVSAASLGLEPGVEVLLGGADEVANIAAGLARDDREAARLSRAGRRFAERRGLRHPAAALAEALGVAGAGVPSSADRARAVLDGLSAPESALEPDTRRLIRELDAGAARVEAIA